MMLDNVKGAQPQEAVSPTFETQYADKFLLEQYDDNDGIRDIAWSPDGQYVAIASLSDNLRVLRLLNNNLYEIDSYSFAFSCYAVDWSPDGQYIAVGGMDDSVRVFAFNGAMLTQIDSFITSADVLSVSWSPNGNYIASCGVDNLVWILIFDGTSLFQLDSYNHGADVNDVHWSPDGNYLAMGGDTNAAVEVRVLFFTGSSLIMVAQFSHGAHVEDVNWRPDGQYLAISGDTGAGGYECSVLMFNGNTLTIIDSFNSANSLLSADWSSDGRYLIVAGVSGGNPECYLFFFDGITLTLISTVSYGLTTQCAVWSPDDKYIATGINNGPSELNIYKIVWGYTPLWDEFNITEDTSTIINVLANDAPDQNEFTITGFSNGTNCQVSFSGNNLSVLPDANWTGTDGFTYNTTDGYGRSFTTNVIINALNTNDLQTIDTANIFAGQAGQLYSNDYDLTDVDGADTHTWSINTNASWLWMDSASGVLSGWPDMAGSYEVEVTATDNNGNAVSTQFTLAISADFDGDGLADSVDLDDDDDGVPDTNDIFPFDPLESLDTDGDGIGNNADTDDDDDGWLDIIEVISGTNTTDNSSMPGDADLDGVADFMDPDFIEKQIYNNLTDFTNSTEWANLTEYNNGTQWANLTEYSNGTVWSNLTEYSNNTNVIYQNQTLNLTDGLEDSDSDGDGWRDIVEILAGSDPLDATSLPPDSDGDGVADFLDAPTLTFNGTDEVRVVEKEKIPLWAVIAPAIAGILGVLAGLGFGRKPESQHPDDRDPDMPEPDEDEYDESGHLKIEEGKPSEEGTVSYVESQNPYDRLG